MNISENYSKGNFELVLKLSSFSEDCDQEFIVCAIPNGGIEKPKFSSGYRKRASNTEDAGSKRIDNAVLAGITKFVECPQQIVPSLVRLERAKERKKVLGQMPTGTTEQTFDFCLGFSKGELGMSLPCSGKLGRSKRGLVKSRPQTFETCDRMMGEGFRQFPLHSDFVNLARTIRISLFDLFIGVFIEKPNRSGLEVSDAFLCHADSLERAKEWTDHRHPAVERDMIRA
jgi:hypothetical protein